MSSISVAGDTSGSVTLSAPAVAGTTVLTLPSVSGTVLTDQSSLNYTGFKNRIVNGACVIDQRNAGASQTNNAGIQYPVDRYIAYGSVASKFTMQQNAGAVTPPVGFSNYIGITSLSAYAVLTGDIFELLQRIEGFNTSDLAWGTASASAVTLSFKVYSSLTGTFGGALQNSAGNRSYPFSYSIPVANTWTTISITIAGDTTGTWIGATNGIGLQVIYGLGVGATGSGTAGSWASAGYYSATGAVSVVGTSGATFYITGVQLEKGSTATSFDYRPYGTELALCQRYLPCINAPSASASTFCNGGTYSAAAGQLFYTFQVVPRIAPTGITLTAASGFSVEVPGLSTTTPTSIVFYSASSQGCAIVVNGTFGVGPAVLKTNSSTAQIQFTGCEL